MKPGVSSLNPYAASYIPLSQRDKQDRTYVTAKDYRSGNEPVQFGAPEQLHRKFSFDPHAHGTEKIPSREVFTVKSHPARGYGSSPQNLNQATDKQILDEEFDMDLEYLQMTFPGLSDQSINDVYLANNGDLEATVDMLNQLEPLTNSLTSDYGSVQHSEKSAGLVVANIEKFETINNFSDSLFQPFESSESLPDTLDIGDVSEFGSSADCVPLKLKNVEGETSAASSSS